MNQLDILLVGFVVAVLAFHVFARTRTTTLVALGHLPSRQSFTTALDALEAFRRVLAYANSHGYAIGDRDDDATSVLLVKHPTLFDYGWFLPVSMSRSGDTTLVVVGVKSKLYQRGHAERKALQRCVTGLMAELEGEDAEASST